MASFDLLTWVLPYDGQGMKGALKPWQQDREDFLFFRSYSIISDFCVQGLYGFSGFHGFWWD